MIYELPNSSTLKVHDLFDPLPAFMLEADTIFADIPYNQALLSNFLNRSEAMVSARNTRRFVDFTARFFECVKLIAPATIFIETGKEALPDYMIAARQLFKYVTFYNATYNHRYTNKAYIIHATNVFKARRYKLLEDLDEEDIIKWICLNHPFACIGDLCMGTGLVGKYAYENGKRFVGIDINSARLQVLVDYITGIENSNGR